MQRRTTRALLVLALCSAACQGGRSTRYASAAPATEPLRPEYIHVHGSRQAILSRMRDDTAPDAPVLLWMHGGPGSTLMPWTEAFDGPLLGHARAMSIVHWDQRCAGLSFDRGTCAGLTIDAMARDAIEVARVIRGRIGRRRLVVVGHSWGTVLALRVARDAAPLIDALVLVGTVADYRLGDEAKLAYLRARQGDAEVSRRVLDDLGAPPFVLREKALLASRLLIGQGAVFGALSMNRLGELRASTHVYGDGDWDRQGAGALASAEQLLPQLADYRALEHVSRIDVPVLFVQGALDMATPTALAHAYYAAVAAPRGKTWREMPGCAHFPMWEQPEAFAEVVATFLHASTAP